MPPSSALLLASLPRVKWHPKRVIPFVAQMEAIAAIPPQLQGLLRRFFSLDVCLRMRRPILWVHSIAAMLFQAATLLLANWRLVLLSSASLTRRTSDVSVWGWRAECIPLRRGFFPCSISHQAVLSKFAFVDWQNINNMARLEIAARIKVRQRQKDRPRSTRQLFSVRLKTLLRSRDDHSFGLPYPMRLTAQPLALSGNWFFLLQPYSVCTCSCSRPHDEIGLFFSLFCSQLQPLKVRSEKGGIGKLESCMHFAGFIIDEIVSSLSFTACHRHMFTWLLSSMTSTWAHLFLSASTSDARGE